jgi:hypothetical protein
MSSLLAPNDQFNAMSGEDKKRVLTNGLGLNVLHSGLAFAVPLWWLRDDQGHVLRLRNGSAFLVDYGHGLFAVTAAHVFAEYREAKKTAHRIVCQLGHALFDPEMRLISCRDELDIATFRVSEDEAKQIKKPAVKPDPPIWEPLNPAVGNFAFFAGFPAQTRGMTSSGDFVTAPYFAMPAITSVTDHQITCRLDREKMIDLGGNGLPPVGYDIGGISGGPLLVPTLVRQGALEGVVWRLGGVIVQAAKGELFEQFVAVRAHYIQPDGRIG